MNLSLCLLLVPLAAGRPAWPPPLAGAKDGTVTLKTDDFLKVPAAVEKARADPKFAPFSVAKVAPAVELALHRDLGPDADRRRLWSSWGDICVASDGRVYLAIGDHGDDAGGDARCLVYRWDPRTSTLERVIDLAQVVLPRKGQPAWSKVHARIDEGPDGKIYFSCTLNDGNRANLPAYAWTKELPGGQLYQYDPKTGKTVAFADLPGSRCTATSWLDRRRNVWWCNLEAGKGNALYGLDLKTKKSVFQAADGSTAFNRAFALGRDGAVYVNGPAGRIWKRPAGGGELVETKSSLPGQGMRAASSAAKDGTIYGATMREAQLFRYRPADDQAKLLGPAWQAGDYVTVVELSPDERFLYYLPGAHGGAAKSGTPLVQYEIATGKRKVLCFLAEAFEKAYDYVPGGTYGMKLSADGATVYVNFNGHAGEKTRPKGMRPNGFGLTAFAAVRVPRPER